MSFASIAADQIVAAIIARQAETPEAAPWSLLTTPRRAWVPIYKGTDLEAMKVDVAPRKRAHAVAAQAYSQKDASIDIAFQVKAKPEELDGLTDLVEAVLEFLLSEDGRELAVCTIQTGGIDPIVAPAKFYEDNVFVSVATVNVTAVMKNV